MSFSLNLERPTPSYPSQPPETYHPGQLLRGTLIYTLPKQRTMNNISLTFRAKLEANYIETRGPTAGGIAGAGLTHGPRRLAPEILRLFEDTRALFEGPYDVPAQTFEWKFEFTVPRRVDVDRSGVRSGKKGGNRGFIDDGLGDLPSSFDWQDRTVLHDATAKIKFKLVARAESSGLFGTDEKEWPVVIRRVAKYPDPLLITVQKEFPGVSWSSQKLRPEGEKLSVRQRLRSVVSDDPALATPSLNFKAWIGMPRCFSVDQRFDVDFAAAYDRKADIDPDKPGLILDSVKLSLIARTRIMVKRGSLVGITINGDRHCYGEHIVAQCATKLGDGGSGILLLLDGTVAKVADTCIGEWNEGEAVNLPGDFVTWIVKHEHLIGVEVVVRHRETGKTWNMRTGFSVQLRDRYVPELAEEDGNEDGDGEGDVLPGYEDDVQPPNVEGEDEKSGEGNSRGEKR